VFEDVGDDDEAGLRRRLKVPKKSKTGT